MSKRAETVSINGTALEVIMERTGFTSTTLGAACVPPVTRSYIANIIAGRRQPSAPVAVAIAKALMVPLAAILSDAVAEGSAA